MAKKRHGSGYFRDELFQQHRDPDTGLATSYLEGFAPQLRSNFHSSSDPASTAHLYSNAVGSEIQTGIILFALPYLHHYKVSLAGGPVISAVAVSPTGNLPLGAKPSEVIATGTSVLLLWPATAPFPYIIGTMPYISSDDKKNSASILQSGGNSHVLKQSGYRQLPAQLVLDGQIQNFGCGRPMDGTNFEHSITTETGTSFLIDSYQAALSIDEGCGLFLNWFDSYCRLAGFQLDIQSYAEHVMQRYDEGENFAFRGSLIYPWESTGAYKPDEGEFTEKYEAKDYQLDPEKPYGSIDLKEDETDIVSIYRYMEYGGYVGQGSTRMLMLPAPDASGRRKASDSDIDYGLWHESVALDGSYTLRSAKSVSIGKYGFIPIPKRLKVPEDPTPDADGWRQKNYKFSGQFTQGGGDDHNIGDLQPQGDDKQLNRVAGVLDLLAFNYNWKSTHPFFYHEGDYNYPDEADLLEKLTSAYYEPNYDDLSSQSYLDSPESAKLEVDHRYEDVEYFQSSSHITLLDDGGVVISDGFGAQITMTGGQIRLEAPGDVMLMPGTRAIALCDEFIVRAKSNIELSSSEKDVRLKAEGNMQLLSGNGGEGGMLIENKSRKPWDHMYDQMYGDDVIDSGITLLTKDSGIGAVGKDIYIRSDAAGNSGGQLTLDGGAGKSNIAMYGKAIHIFESEGMTLWEGPEGTDPGAMKETHRFHGDATLHSSPIYCDGDIVTMKNLIAGKHALARKNIMSGEKLAHYGTFMEVGDLTNSDPDIRAAIEEATQQVSEGLANIISMGEPAFKGSFEELYSDNHLGNTEFISNIMGFSFNDKKNRPNPYGYSPDKFKLLEAKWQRKVDGKKASWGKAWTETSVVYQGAQSYPWPGEDHWTASSFLTGPELKYIDGGSGKYYGKGREDAFKDDDFKLKELTPAVPDGTYILIGGD